MSQKKKGAIRFDFPFGTDEWEFAYVTILYIRRVQLGYALENNNKEVIKILESIKVQSLCRDTIHAYTKREWIKLDTAQTLYFVRSVDSLAKTLINDSDLVFADELAEILNREIKQCRSGFEIRFSYLEMAASFVDEYKRLCSKIESGDRILKSIGLT